MKITEQLKDVLSEEDLKSLEQGIKDMVAEEVAIRKEEIENKLEEQAEEFCKIKIEEGVAEQVLVLKEESDRKIEELEENITDQLDNFIASEITEQISEEAVTILAKKQIHEPLIEGIIELFESKYCALDIEGSGMLKALENTNAELKESNSQLIADKMELNEMAETAAIKLIIQEKTQDLTESQKERINTLLEGSDFDKVSEKIDSVVSIVENDETDGELISEDAESNFSDEDGISEDVDADETEETITESTEDGESDNGFKAFIDTAEKFI